MKDEKQYIEEIIELKKENDELCDLLQDATVKIKELNLKLSLSNCGHGKTAKDRKIENYETRISELEQMANLVSTASLSDYEMELAELTKTTIKLRLRLDELSKSHKRRNEELDLSSELDNLNGEILKRFVNVIYLHNEICKMKCDELPENSINDLLDGLDVVPIMFNKLLKDIKEQRDENKRLNKIIEEHSDVKTIQELKNEIADKDSAIDFLKNKIELLEQK